MSSSKRANLAVRLCDLSPAGTSKLISWRQLKALEGDKVVYDTTKNFEVERDFN